LKFTAADHFWLNFFAVIIGSELLEPVEEGVVELMVLAPGKKAFK